MYIYNITFSVDIQLRDFLMDWLKEEYIPQVNECAGFSNPQVVKVLGEKSSVTSTYCCQFDVASIMDVQLFLNHTEQIFTAQLAEKFKDRCVGFSTVLQRVS